MKRFLLSGLLVLLCIGQVRGEQIVKQSTATEVDLKFVDATDGVTAETALDVTTFDCNLIKHANASLTNTTITVTASGGTNDSTHLADGIYRLELSASNTDTLGRLSLYCQCSGAVPFEAHYTVVGADVYESEITDVATIGDIFGYPTTSIATAGSIGVQIKDNLDVPVSAYSLIKNRTTIATLSSQTSFTLTAGSPSDNSYKDWTVYVQDDGDATVIAKGRVSAYTGSTKTVTLGTDPAVFTMAVGDVVYLVPEGSLKPTVDNMTLDVSTTGEAGVDFSNVGGVLNNNEISTGAISSSTFAAGAIDATAIASDAIGSPELASTAITEIQTGLLTVPRNTAYSNFTFEMVDSTDGTSLETGLTVTCQIAKDGGSLASCSNSVSEIGSGLYKIDFTSSDLNADEVWLRLTATGARRLSYKIRTQK